MMCAVDVHIHCGKAICKTLRYEAKGGQVIAFVELVASEDVKNARVAFEARGVQREVARQVSNSTQPLLGLLDGDSPYDSVDLVTQSKQVFGQVTSILASNSGNQRFLQINSPLFSRRRRFACMSPRVRPEY